MNRTISAWWCSSISGAFIPPLVSSTGRVGGLFLKHCPIRLLLQQEACSLASFHVYFSFRLSVMLLYICFSRHAVKTLKINFIPELSA